MELKPSDIADQIVKSSPEKVALARRLAKKISGNRDRIRLTKNNSDVVNYEYWATRCHLEQMPEALRARELAYSARRVFKEDADLLEARRLYEESFSQWATVLKGHPELPLDSVSADDIMEYVGQYSSVLQQLELTLADEAVGRTFPLWELVAANDSTKAYAAGTNKFLNAREPSVEKPTSDVPPEEETIMEVPEEAAEQEPAEKEEAAADVESDDS